MIYYIASEWYNGNDISIETLIEMTIISCVPVLNIVTIFTLDGRIKHFFTNLLNPKKIIIKGRKNENS